MELIIWNVDEDNVTYKI